MTFGSTFGRVFSPTFQPKSQAAVAVSNWWLAGGISASNAIVVYQSKGAASYAASKVNLANPGTYDATDGAAYPTWDGSTGWTFNGTSQYLDTNYVPSAGASLSLFVRLNGTQTQDGKTHTVVGQHDAGSPYNGVYVRLLTVAVYAEPLYANDGLAAKVITNRSGDHVIGVAGRQGYYDGSTDGEAFSDSASAFGNYALVMGALRYSSIIQFMKCDIYAVAIYNTAITAAQVTALTTAMNAL